MTPPGRRCRCPRPLRSRTFVRRCASGAGSGGWPASLKATGRWAVPETIRPKRSAPHGIPPDQLRPSALAPHMAHAPDPNEAIQRFLGQWSPLTRAEALHLALQSLRDRVEPDRVLACELAWEVHAKGYWSQVRNADGTTYPTEEDYFRHVLGLASWRTAYKRLAIGRMLTRFEEPERSLLRSSLAAVGLAKATVVAPAIERVEEWRTWLQCASEMSTVLLQAKVSEALDALPRGREPAPPGERFRHAVLAAMPDIEAMEVVERFFHLGKRVVASPNPIAIFLAGCRECLPEWELQAAKCPPASSSVSNSPVCRRGQTSF